jgi:hypothetical protein
MRHRARRREARPAQACLLHHVQAEAHAHRGLDRRAADLTVALSGVAVAARQQSSGDLDGQQQDATHGNIPGVEVAAEAPRRQRRERALRSRRHADLPREGLERYADPGRELGVRRVCVEVPGVQGRLVELGCQQAELGEDGGPPPSSEIDALDRDAQRVSRHGTADFDRTEQRWHPVPVQSLEIGHRRVGVKLPVRRIVEDELH